MKRSYFVFAMISITATALLSSCNHVPPIPSANDRPAPKVEAKLDEQAVKLGTVRDSVTTEATSIKTNSEGIRIDAESGKKVADAPQWNSIQERSDRIKASGDVLLGRAQEITQVQVELQTANAQLKELEAFSKSSLDKQDALSKIIATQKEEIDAYKSGAKRQQQVIWMGVSGLSAIGLVLGIALAIYVSPKTGVGMIVGSLILAPISYFFAQYAAISAIVGGVMFLIVIGYLLVWAAMHRKALVETMISFEVSKNKVWTDPSTKQEVNSIQSNSTKNIVKQVKFEENIG
jgi:hypothetical protein